MIGQHLIGSHAAAVTFLRGYSAALTKTLVAVIFVSVSACTDTNNFSTPPPQLLTKQEMVSFLIDLHITEAKMNYAEVRNSDSLEIFFRNYELHLMEEHGIEDSLYLQSYAYYLENMGIMNEIYEDVVDSLSVIDTQQKARVLEDTTRSP